MISKSVIMAVLIGIAVTGAVPVVGGIVLLAARKLKASSFWAGVLTYVIAIIVYTIIASIVSAVMMAGSDSVNEALDAVEEQSAGLSLVLSIALGIVFSLSLGICIGSCMKKTRTWGGAVSCGAGLGTAYLVTQAVGFLTYYTTFASINSGEFDKQYAELVETGLMDKETVSALKSTYTSYTAADAVSGTVLSAGIAVLFAAAAIFIMRSVCVKKLFAGVGSSFLLITAQSFVSSVIPNVIAGAVIALAIGAAALVYACRMKEKIVPPPKDQVRDDSFMRSVESAKADTAGTEGAADRDGEAETERG